jgi:hypothetical protein
MSRAPHVAIATAIALSFAASATLASEATTTRIEPRPFYGATVTLEAGVRVFRPLPPHKNIIINPEHKTPLNLTIEDVTEKRTITGNYTHNYYDRSGDDGAGVTGGPYYYGGLRARRGHRKASEGRFRGHRGGRRIRRRAD